jgi:hypothetical protein
MATLSQAGIPGAGSTLLHPKLAHKWRVTFVGIAKLAGGANSRNLTLQAVSVSRPSMSFDPVTINRYNSTATVLGKHSFEDCSLTIEDDITGLAAKVVHGQLETQQRLIGVDLNGRWLNSAATGSDYKFGTKIELLDGDEGVVEAWNLEGCSIVSADFGSMDYSSSDAVQIQLSIKYDHAFSILTGAGYGTGVGGFMSS